MIIVKHEEINSEEASSTQVKEKIKNSLLTLSIDPWKEIFSHLNPIEASRIARTCKFFNKLKNERNATESCYLIVAVPDGVKSPEDFMKKIIAFKESNEMLIKFTDYIFKGPFASVQDGYYKYAYDRNVDKNCLVKIKLPFSYAQYLIEDSGCYCFGSYAKPENFIKIIDSMETPSVKHMRSYLLKKGLSNELKNEEETLKIRK